eukprot:m.15225 g.15225  ORF g.15225 m.15225 type:complete len:317 (+) comp10433_c0_seq6:64-1014(+)
MDHAQELRLELLYRAVTSTKPDQLTRPFPSAFDNDGEKQFAALLAALESDSADVVSWLSTLQPVIKLASPSLYDELQQQTGKASYPVTPTHVFTVHQPGASANPSRRAGCISTVSIDSAKKQRFEQAKATYGSLLAYHGSGTECWHSIIGHGFVGHLNRTSLYGKGTYLSNDVTLCRNYSKASPCRPSSQLGQRMSVIGVCEIAKHPGVKFAGDTADEADTSSLDGKVIIPDKYIVVPNDDLLELKYLLVYVDAHPTSIATVSRWSSFWAFVRRHGILLAVIFYVLLLVVAGWWKTPAARAWSRRIRLWWSDLNNL